MDVRFPLWATLALASPLSAQSYRLNDPFPPGPTVGQAFGPAISADGTYVVYTADQEGSEPAAVYSVRADGGTLPVKLVSGDPTSYALSPDGKWLVYHRGQLHSIPIQGGEPPRRLSTAGAVQLFQFSAVTERVLFVVKSGGLSSLHSVPIDGSAPALQLSPALPTGVAIEELRISGDGLHALYLARKAGVQAELFTGPVDGSAGAVLVQRVTAPADIQPWYYTASHLDFSPDGTRVVFRADKDSDEVYELFSAPRDGSAAAVKLSGTLAVGEDVLDHGFGAAGARVVYRTQPGSGARLWSAPLDGSAAPIELTTNAHQGAYEFRVDPTGTRVVFQAFGPRAQIDLFTVPTDGGSGPVRINDPLANLEGPLVFKITPDGNRVVYAAAEGNPRVKLYSVPIDGSPGRILLSGPGGGVLVYPLDLAFALGADGVNVVYRADPEFDAVFHLFSAPLDGSTAPITLAAPTFPSAMASSLLNYRVASAGACLVYQHDQDEYDVREIYGVPIDGSSPPVKLNSPLPTPASDDVASFEIASDSRRAVYGDKQGTRVVATSGRSDPEALASPFVERTLSPDGLWMVYMDGVGPHVFGVPLDRSSPAFQLSGPYAPSGAFLPGARLLGISPDSTRVVYRANQDLNASFDVYSIAIDGSGPSVNLSGVGGGGLRIQTVKFGPDSTCAYYRADPDNDGLFTLFRAPLDGSAPALTLSGGSSGVDVESFQLSPDGTRVVYVAHHANADRLYSVPSSGQSDPTLLAGPLVGYGNVVEYELSRDGTHVVYRADQDVNELFELFVVPSDGSAAPARLHSALVPGGDVIEHHIAPDGGGVVFLADAEVDEVFELFQTRLSPPFVALRLSGSLTPHGDVSPGFVFRHAQNHVVYRADPEQNSVHELFEVPLDGSASPSKLSGPMAAGGDVLPGFQVSPDGSRVLYRADQEGDGVNELFVAFDATAPGRRVNDALVPGGDVLSFRIAPDGKRVLYLADQANDEVVELFAVGLPPRSLRRAP